MFPLITHQVHRMTHRVVRGTLLCCGRPDGRLSALTATENAVCLSINQASSIQSVGSTCETVTIGHNMFKLPLSTRAVFLNRHRPLFLCEYLLAEKDNDEGIVARDAMSMSIGASRRSSIQQYAPHLNNTSSVHEHGSDTLLQSLGKLNIPDRRSKANRVSTSAALLGQYKRIESHLARKLGHGHDLLDVSEKVSLKTVVNKSIQEKKWLTKARRLFEHIDTDHNGILKLNEFVDGLSELKCDQSEDELTQLFMRL